LDEALLLIRRLDFKHPLTFTEGKNLIRDFVEVDRDSAHESSFEEKSLAE
jgi:hypothetical protein